MFPQVSTHPKVALPSVEPSSKQWAWYFCVSGFGTQNPTIPKQSPPLRTLLFTKCSSKAPTFKSYCPWQLWSGGNFHLYLVTYILSHPATGSFKTSCAKTKCMVYPRSHCKKKNREYWIHSKEEPALHMLDAEANQAMPLKLHFYINS